MSNIMKDFYISKKDIIIPKGTKFTQWSNEDKKNGTYSFVVELDRDHVLLPSIKESDISEALNCDYLE